MRVAIGVLVAAAALGGARFARHAASEMRGDDSVEAPYAPSPSAAPFLSLGYRELAADLLFVRLTGYFGGKDNDAEAIASLVEAIIALDPQFERPYEYGARAMTMARTGVDQPIYLRALAVLDKGMKVFTSDWRIPYLAGQIYTQDLQTSDEQQRRAWDERGTLLVESAIRKPRAPAEAAEWAAVMRTKLGQHERAVQGLREVLLVTSDRSARAALLQKLAELENKNAAELAAELAEDRHRFEDAWDRDRPFVSRTMYVLLGPRSAPGFDLADIATGGRDLVGSEELERLEPLD
ncbi:MAG TPA: hypothetical protein VIV11_42300 [Kofleriaceae bacterium]